jgi:hypothetical protein
MFDPPVEGLNIALKWNLDTTHLLCRELYYSSSLPSLTLMNSKTPLLEAGWAICRTAMESLLPLLKEQMDKKMAPSTPVVLYCLDNSCFKVLIARDQKCHVAGDLEVRPPHRYSWLPRGPIHGRLG